MRLCSNIAEPAAEKLKEMMLDFLLTKNTVKDLEQA